MRARPGEQYFAVLVSSKGDLKHHMECGYLTRSYHKMGKKRQKMMCSLCHAGDTDLDFEDCSEDPPWSRTLYSSRPWTVTPPLASVPYDTAAPERVFALDLFHLHKVGLGRHLVGAAIVVLCGLGLFDTGARRESKALPKRLGRAHSNFVLWTLAERVKPGLRSFKLAFFNIKSKQSFPWCNSKGSDTTLLTRWLRFLTRLYLQEPSNAFTQKHGAFLRLLKHEVEAALDLFHVVHSHGLWIERGCAKYLYARLMTVLKGYKALAMTAKTMGVAGFALIPKFHAMHHVALNLALDLERGADCVLNPLMDSCEQNEDVVGRICRLARRLSTRTITSRVLTRHFFKKRAVMSRFVKVKGYTVRGKGRRRQKK